MLEVTKQHCKDNYKKSCGYNWCFFHIRNGKEPVSDAEDVHGDGVAGARELEVLERPGQPGRARVVPAYPSLTKRDMNDVKKIKH